MLLREGLESGSLPSFFSGSYGAESPTRQGAFQPCGARPHALLFLFLFRSKKKEQGGHRTYFDL